MTETKILPLLTWRSAICDSGLPATTRHVALTLSLWMNERAASAFPSVPTLVNATGLSERAVRSHLHDLVNAGWLKLVKESAGQRRGNEYEASTPAPVAPAPTAPLHLTTRTGAPDDADGCTSCSQSLKDLSTNSASGSPPNGGPDLRVKELVGGYVDDYRAERNGLSPSRRFIGAAGRAVKQALADGRTPQDIARCLGVIAHEGKQPSSLEYVIGDYHAGRERRMK